MALAVYFGRYFNKRYQLTPPNINPSMVSVIISGMCRRNIAITSLGVSISPATAGLGATTLFIGGVVVCLCSIIFNYLLCQTNNVSNIICPTL
jgi:hypothetical protein